MHGALKTKNVLWIVCLMLMPFTAGAAPVVSLVATGADLVLPGDFFEFAVVGITGGPFEPADYFYAWAVTGDDGQPVDPEAYRIEQREWGSEIRLHVSKNEFAWKLYGASVTVKVTPEDTPAFSAVGSLGEEEKLAVAILATPFVDTLILMEKDEVVLEPWAVYGGNAPAEDLSYQWQQYRNGHHDGRWDDIPGAIAPDYAVRSSTTSAWDYRCLIDLKGRLPTNVSHGAKVGSFEVRGRSGYLIVGKPVAASAAVVPPGAEVTATTTIANPLNKAYGATTTYTYGIYRHSSPYASIGDGSITDMVDDNGWIEVQKPVSERMNKSAGDAVAITFPAAEGSWSYRLRVESDAILGVAKQYDVAPPFTVVGARPERHPDGERRRVEKSGPFGGRLCFPKTGIVANPVP